MRNENNHVESRPQGPPAELRQLSVRLWQAEPHALWVIFLQVACDAIALVKAGTLDRIETGRALRDWGDRYFDTQDEQSHFSVDCVVRAFAHATRPKVRIAA